MAHGHAHDAIRSYTLAQFDAYLVEAHRLDSQALRAQLLAVNLGLQGGDGLRRALKAAEADE